MLEVHPPEHAPHGVRDFFLHIFTITIGLLIALGLESLVEWRHHVHLRHEAEHNIRREIEANRKDLATVLNGIPRERENLKGMMNFLKQREAGHTVNVRSLPMGLTMLTPQESSWQTATVTNALGYMPYEEVERFSSAYTLQREVQVIQNNAMPSITSLATSLLLDDPNGMKPAEATAATAHVRAVMANVEIIRGICLDLDKAYAEALKE